MRENGRAVNGTENALVDNLKSEVEHPTRPCSKQWEAYQKALAEVVEGVEEGGTLYSRTKQRQRRGLALDAGTRGESKSRRRVQGLA